MPEQQKRDDALTQSMRLHDIYPKNLLQTAEFPHVLELLSSLLLSSQKLFKAGKDTLTLRDLQSDDNGSFKYHDEVLKGTKKLDEFLTVDKPDPYRRLCFIQSASSRDPLECSRSQLTKVFSRHQVMAKFLEAVFTFERREKPHNYTSFQCEDIRAPLDHPSNAPKVPGSCVRIQHCFNLLGMELYESEPAIWRQRQVAAYHSFDPVDGKVFWTVIKGNGVIQERMKRATDKDLASQPKFANSIYLSFQQSLREHLLLLQWAVENWMSYIQSLENKARGKTEITRYPHIKELADDVPVRQMEHRKSTMDKSHPIMKHKTGIIRAVSQHFKPFSMHAHAADVSSKTKPSDASANGTTPEPSSPLRTATHLKYETIELDKLATFSDLQDLTSIADELRSGVSIIEQNKRVFADMRERYIELGNSVLLKNSLQDQELTTGFQSAISVFTRQISHMSADLENYQARLRAILETTDQARDMYNYIFQLRNTQNTEFYAGAAQESSEVMQELTLQMHEKTMSMHLITIFTLIFLPGTFVAILQTLFSSGILVFGNEGESGFGTKLGDWKVRMASLKLFFVICFPLLVVTLGVWFLAYRNVRNNNSKKIGDEEDGTLGRAPERG